MIGDVFSVPWLSGLAWKYTNTVWKTTQHSRFWLVNVRATRASYWPDSLCTVLRAWPPSHGNRLENLSPERPEPEPVSCPSRRLSACPGQGWVLCTVPLSPCPGQGWVLCTVFCLRVPGRGEYCALCLCLPAIPHKIFTRNIMGFKTIQTQPRSAWSGRLAGWCEATFDISFNYPLPSPRSDVWSGLKHPMWHHTLQ